MPLLETRVEVSTTRSIYPLVVLWSGQAQFLRQW
jgi:hypothetical protein